MTLKKIQLILVLSLYFIPQANCQNVTYGGMQQFGLVFGERNTNVAFTMVNGVRFHKFFTGLGADITFRDYGLPSTTTALYADGRYYINKEKNFFGKVNGGINLPLQGLDANDYYNYKRLTGFYSAFGLGFKARLGKEVFYTFDVSYCIRQTRYIQNTRNSPWSWGWPDGGEWRTEKFDIRKYAIMVNMGLEIF